MGSLAGDPAGLLKAIRDAYLRVQRFPPRVKGLGLGIGSKFD